MKSLFLSLFAVLALTVQAAPRERLPVGLDNRQIAALPDGQWLVQQKKRLLLLGADGTERASLALRSEALDLRADSEAYLALVLDQDRQRVRLLRIDGEAGKIEEKALLPEQTFTLGLVCLYRDHQALLQAFLIGEDGRAEQWLLSGARPRQLRTLALAPGAVACSVDDAHGELLLAEPGIGVWRYPADPEQVFERRLLPLGAAGAKVRSLSVTGIGVLALDGSQLLRLERRGEGFRKPLARPLSASQFALEARPDAPRRGVRTAAGWLDLKLDAGGRSVPRPATLPVVQARVQTAPVSQYGDAADDPAIWVDPRSAAGSLVLATNKKQGLLVYDLEGRERQLLTVGRINNVDLRQRVDIGGRLADIAIATHRDRKTLIVFEIDAEGRVGVLGEVPTGLDEAYGACLARTAGGGLDAIANDKDGRFHQIHLGVHDGVVQGSIVRRFRLASQPEGCVADEANGRLFVGEEDRGIWALPLAADAQAKVERVMAIGETLRADVEGMAIYAGRHRSYLIVSSQGNSSYVVLEAQPPYRYRGAFRIGINSEAGIDGVSDTDGLDVSAVDLGPSWRHGMLVVQDGRKRLPDGPQNFKYVAWADIEKALGLD